MNTALDRVKEERDELEKRIEKTSNLVGKVYLLVFVVHLLVISRKNF